MGGGGVVVAEVDEAVIGLAEVVAAVVVFVVGLDVVE